MVGMSNGGHNTGMSPYAIARAQKDAGNLRFPGPLQCLFSPKRFKVLWGGRGAGR